MDKMRENGFEEKIREKYRGHSSLSSHTNTTYKKSSIVKRRDGVPGDLGCLPDGRLPHCGSQERWPAGYGAAGAGASERTSSGPLPNHIGRQQDPRRGRGPGFSASGSSSQPVEAEVPDLAARRGHSTEYVHQPVDGCGVYCGR